MLSSKRCWVHIDASCGDTTTVPPTVVHWYCTNSSSTLVNSVALAVGAIAPITVSFLAYTKAKSHDPKIDEAINTGIAVGKVATATANKAIENKENIKSIIDIGLQIAPQDVQQAVAAKQALIDKLNKEIQATTVQIKQLAPMVRVANAD